METTNYFITTIGAKEFAKDINNSAKDVNINWWEFFSNYRLKKWRRELKRSIDEKGSSLEELCEYLGAEVTRYPGFYKRLPKHRETYIGIGIALGQSIDTINRWITKYCMKNRLYVKDMFNDLIWIYLINAAQKDNSGSKNYFLEYQKCREEVESIYAELWTSNIDVETETKEMEDSFNVLEYDNDHTKLKLYVRDNIGAFRTAYAKARQYLNRYLVEILRVKNLNLDDGHRWTLNSLRGWLDDSMINYLSGSLDSYNTVDRERNVTSRFRQVPKNKKTHVALCLALGMSMDAIDEYLALMGYSPLDAVNPDEGQLINLLNKWEKSHEMQNIFKDRYFRGTSDVVLTADEELRAVNEMLFLRDDLKNEFEKECGEGFPYM